MTAAGYADSEILKAISIPYCMDILIYLRNIGEPVHMIDVMSVCGSYPTAKKKLGLLAKAGLIKKTRGHKAPGNTICIDVRLSVDGEKVARHLDEIRALEMY